MQRFSAAHRPLTTRPDRSFSLSLSACISVNLLISSFRTLLCDAADGRHRSDGALEALRTREVLPAGPPPPVHLLLRGLYPPPMKPPHSNRHGGAGRPPGSGRPPGRRPARPSQRRRPRRSVRHHAPHGQPHDRQQRRDHAAGHVQGARGAIRPPARPASATGPPDQRGPRPQGKPFQSRPPRTTSTASARATTSTAPTASATTPPPPSGHATRRPLALRPARGGRGARQPARRLRHLMLTEEAQQTLAQRQPPPWPLPPEQVERGRLDHLLGRDIAHQGAALLADPLGTPSLQQALDRTGPLIVLDQVTDPRNVGAILRSAAAFGVAAVITQDRNAPEETGALAKAASGALETIPLLRAVNIARTLIALKAAGIWTVGLDTGGAAAVRAVAGRAAASPWCSAPRARACAG